jgi:hypothetical protein
MNTSNIEITLHSASLKHSSMTGGYWHFNADVVTTINVSGLAFPVVLQPGQSFYHGNYNTPAYELDYSDEGGCHPFVVKLWSYTESDLENLDDEDWQELMELAGSGLELSSDKLISIYLYLCDLRIDAQNVFDVEIEENGQTLKDQYLYQMELEKEMMEN